MKLRFVRLIGAAILWLCASAASAQAYHQLTIDDFEGIPHFNTGVVAYTNCSIDFRYEAHHMRDYYRLDFNIRLIINHDKSWMDRRSVTSKTQLDEILKHEQGHYIIAYLEQQELLRTVGRTVFYADYQQQAKYLFDRIDAKYRQLNLDYDADTHHMTNREQQVSWDAYFKKQLDYLPPV
jgi:hypothetical protein